MSDQNELSRSERDLEAALGRLRPASTQLARDRLMFQAGQAAGRRPGIWPFVSLSLAVCLSLSLSRWPSAPMRTMASAVRPGATVQAGTAPANPGILVQDFPEAEDTPNPSSYLQLRKEILTRGLDLATLNTSGLRSGQPLHWHPWRGGSLESVNPNLSPNGGTL